MFKKIIEKIKNKSNLDLAIIDKDIDNTKWLYRFPLMDGSCILIDEEQKEDLHYFCDDEGIKYGSKIKNANRIIVPKDVLIEAINTYMGN